MRRSNWNARAVSILSTELQGHIKDGKVEHVLYDSKTMNLKFCEKQIIQRLDRIRRDKIAHDANTLKAAQERNDQIERRRSRRKTVSPF